MGRGGLRSISAEPGQDYVSARQQVKGAGICFSALSSLLRSAIQACYPKYCPQLDFGLAMRSAGISDHVSAPPPRIGSFGDLLRQRCQDEHSNEARGGNSKRLQVSIPSPIVRCNSSRAGWTCTLYLSDVSSWGQSFAMQKHCLPCKRQRRLQSGSQHSPSVELCNNAWSGCRCTLSSPPPS